MKTNVKKTALKLLIKSAGGKRALARLLVMSHSMPGMWLNNKKNITLKSANKLSAVSKKLKLNLKVDDFIRL